MNTDKTETLSSSNILDTSFPMVDFKLTCRNAFFIKYLNSKALEF